MSYPRFSINSLTQRVAAVAAIIMTAATAALPAAPRVAFVGKDANFTDEFSFVAVEDLSPGTVVFFTNYDWENTSGTFPTATSEGVIQFTATGLIPKGSVVHVAETSANTYTVTGAGTAIHVAGAADWAAVSADPHYAFAASNPASPLNTVTEVYAYLDTDPDVAVGGVKDPRTGVNASPGAQVTDFTVTQPVGVDFVGDRTVAGFGNLAHPVNFTETSGSTDLTLDLSPFPNIAAGAIFVDGFESGALLGWSTAVGGV